MSQISHEVERRYDTKEASEYLAQRGVKYTPGSMAVMRCKKKGPAYVTIMGKPYYPQSALDAFAAGIPVLTIS